MSLILAGFDFDGPYPLDQWTPPQQAGVYAILTHDDTPDHDPTYTPRFFGRTEDLAAHDPRQGRARMTRCTAEAGTDGSLYIGVHYMPGATKFNRQMVVEALLATYHPAGNYAWTWSPQDGLVHRLYT